MGSFDKVERKGNMSLMIMPFTLSAILSPCFQEGPVRKWRWNWKQVYTCGLILFGLALWSPASSPTIRPRETRV